MTNEIYIKSFLGARLWFTHYGNLKYSVFYKTLYSYDIVIAQRYNDVILINITDYNSKVKKHVNLLLEYIKEYNTKVIFVKDVPEDAKELRILSKEHYIYV